MAIQLIQLGLQDAQKFDFKSGGEAVKMAAELVPERPGIKLLAANLFAQGSWWRSAFFLYQSCKKPFEEYGFIHELIGDGFVAIEQTQKAIKSYEMALMYSPDQNQNKLKIKAANTLKSWHEPRIQMAPPAAITAPDGTLSYSGGGFYEKTPSHLPSLLLPFVFRNRENADPKPYPPTYLWGYWDHGVPDHYRLHESHPFISKLRRAWPELAQTPTKQN